MEASWNAHDERVSEGRDAVVADARAPALSVPARFRPNVRQDGDLLVSSDITADYPVSEAELAAVEAFLMPIVTAIMEGRYDMQENGKNADESNG